MDRGSSFIWIPLLLFYVSDSRQVSVHHGVNMLTSRTGNSGLDQIITQTPSVTIETCNDMKEELMSLNKQLEQKTLRNYQLNEDAIGLRREVKMLEMKLSTCNTPASAVTSSYQTQLNIKMKQLLKTFDTDTFLILKTLIVIVEVNALQKAKLATNSTESSIVLQRELQEKTDELNLKKAQINRNHPNSELILQILSLQNQIWDLQQAESREGEISLHLSQKILALQQQVERSINELRRKTDDNASLLELIFLHSKITVNQKIINVHIEKFRTNADDFHRQWKQKVDLLKRKIIQLNQDENNTELTKEILALQNEVQELRQSMINSKNTVESQLKELRVILEQDKRQFRNLQKQMEETEFAQTQMIIKIIGIMKEVRELQEDKQQVTSKNQETIAQTLLQAKEREYAKAQAEIKELQRKLQTTTEECSGLEGSYAQLKIELGKKTAELNTTGDPKVALIFNVINLHNDLKALKDQLSTTEDRDMITELRTQVEEKQKELNSRKADIMRLIAYSQLVLRIIEVQNMIWDLQKKPANETTSDRIKELQGNVENLISGVNGRGDREREENTELVLKIMMLQSEVVQLQRQLAGPQMLGHSQVTQLRNKLTTKNGELQKCISELNEKNQTNAKMILKVTDLHNQLRNLEAEQHNDDTSPLTITQLREKLKVKMMQHCRDQAVIRELQRAIELKREECSELEERYKEIKIEFQQKIAELNGTGDSRAALVLNLINLHTDIKDLKFSISTTEDPDRISELQMQLENKQDELSFRFRDLEEHTAISGIISSVFELQKDIWEPQKKAANESAGLQKRVDDLISMIDDKDNEKIKLMLKVMTLRSQVEHFQLSGFQMSQTPQVTKLWEQLKAKEKEQAQDQAEIKALQQKLNQTEEQCSNFEQQLEDLQKDLDVKITELQSTSDSVTSLALQVSTINLQLMELNRQLQNTESKTKMKQLQKNIDEKNNELDKKTEELKARSFQPQRLLKIIELQTEIAKLVHVATNDTDFAKIKAMHDHLSDLIDGIIDENNENIKLMFMIFAQKDEMERLKKQEESQRKAHLERIKELENDLEDIRNEIKEKTLVLDSSDSRIANLSAQIMELHKKIKPLEDKLSYLTETNAEDLAELKKRMEMRKQQLQDTERLLSDADTKNFKLIMEIAELRTQLKTAQEIPSTASKNINELEQQLAKQERENEKLVGTNKGLRQEVKDLKMCCNDFNTQCEELERELQEAQNNADRQSEQLFEKDLELNQLKLDLESQRTENNNLEDQYGILEANVTQLQQKLEGEKLKNKNLQDDYSKLEIEKKKLEDTLKKLQNQTKDVEEKTIYASQVALDPDTAHRRIALSADNTEMSTSEELLNVPDYPGRFDVLLAALGSTGYSSGRHYWQVSVAGKHCYHVGMATESIQRKGQLMTSPETGYWTILLNKQGQYKALDTRKAIIPIQVQPLTLGILLDYKKGRISFYDAAARSHMYTFEGHRFTEKIYPFIHLCDEEDKGQIPIILLPPGTTDWII